MIFKELKLSLTIFGLLRKVVYTLLNAHSICPVNGIGIGQLEVVKGYGFLSFRSSYKEYSLYSTLFDLNSYIAL